MALTGERQISIESRHFWRSVAFHVSVTQSGSVLGPRAQQEVPMRLSPRFVERALASALCMTVGVAVGATTTAQAAPLGSDVSYPLRHSFSMAVGLPGAGKHEPTSCYDKN